MSDAAVTPTGALTSHPAALHTVQGGTPVCLLSDQHRMHPAIAAWPSARFYGGRLRDAPGVRGGRRSAAFHAAACFPPLALFDCRRVAPPYRPF